MNNSFVLKRVLILLILSYLFFFFGNSFLALTDPDEVFYTLTAKEMAAHGQWLTAYIFDHPQFEKPILLYWLLKAALHWWGATPFSMRLFPAIFACLGVLGTYALGFLGFQNERKAFYCALVLCTGAFYAGMGKTVFTDMVFSVLILYSLLAFYIAFNQPRFKSVSILGFYVFMALAVLTKGPLGFFVPQLIVCLFLLYRNQIKFVFNVWSLAGFVVFLALAVPWYVYEIKLYGHAYTREFFYNDHWRRLIEAEHKGNDHWFFYPVTMIAGLFPWSLFFVAALVAIYKRLKWGITSFDYFVLSWILIVFAVFESAHSKLASYILPLFPALALLTGGYVEEALTSQSRLVKIFGGIMAGVLFLFGIAAVAAFPAYKKYVPSMLPGYFLSASLIVLCAGIVIFILKDKLGAALGLLSISLLPVMWSAFLMGADIQPYVSTFDAAQYVPHAPIKTVLLSAKPYARGLRYYTGEQVAVLDIHGGNYFSPHPIPILTQMDELVVFLKAQKTTFAVLKKGGYKTLHQLPANQFHVQLIKQVGYDYVVKIESLPHP